METQNNIFSDDILLINSDIKSVGDEKPFYNGDFSTKNLLDEKSLKSDEKSQLKNLSDEKLLKTVEPFTLSGGIEPLIIIQSSPTDTNSDLSDLVIYPSQETDFDFSTLIGVAPPSQPSDSGNDTLIGNSSYFFGDDNPNNISAAGSFIQTYIWGLGGNDSLTRPAWQK